MTSIKSSRKGSSAINGSKHDEHHTNQLNDDEAVNDLIDGGTTG